jgi:asparagine synthase (glutamine-hydrolysing)
VLSLRLRLRDLRSANWSWSGDRWLTAHSVIRPISTPALASTLWIDNTGHGGLLIQEHTGTDRPSDGQMRPRVVADVGQALTRAAPANGEYLRICWEPGRVALNTGPLGTAPLLLSARGDVLVGSWHLPDLMPMLSLDRLLDRAIARRLTRWPRYSQDTVFHDVYRLTERATATFTERGLSLTYPEPAEHVLRARRLRAGSNVVAAFSNLLTDVLAITPAVQDHAGVELSGGADSANVALALATLHDRPVASYGLVLDGEVGRQQQRRRAAMVRRFGLRDASVRAIDHPPFAPAGIRGRGAPHDPVAAYYREAFDALRDRVAAGGTRVICTGLGGDELMAPAGTPLTCEPVPWLGAAARAALTEIDTNLAPVPAAPMTALMAQATHNPAYVAAGIWPVTPLAHPMLVRFGEQLPLPWRRRKRILRESLRRAGLAAEVVDPPLRETFSELMQVGLRQHGLPILKAMLSESVLVDLGYLDHAALAAAYEIAQAAARVPSVLCDALTLEVGLRSLDQARCGP